MPDKKCATCFYGMKSTVYGNPDWYCFHSVSRRQDVVTNVHVITCYEMRDEAAPCGQEGALHRSRDMEAPEPAYLFEN